MLIEQNTNYAYMLKYMDNPTFDKVRELSTKFHRELPQTLQDELFEALNRGIDILDSEPQMTAYLYAFGKMHQAKLNYAFGKLPEEFLEQPEINIIDYGCGQALGTMCYVDFLRDNGYNQKIKHITLIEPSEMCLKRAALNTSLFLPKTVIVTVNRVFDELDEDDILFDKDIPTLHLFSNVLDILDFDLERFAELINVQIRGYNQFVCVGPYFNSDRDERMEELCSYLNGETNYTDVLDKFELNDEKSWTCQIHIFSVGLETQISNAFEQYKKLAKKGDAKAQNYIGVCYYNGEGVSQDYEKAVEWFLKAAGQGYELAQFHLGYCYYKGKGLSKDNSKAFYWFSKAANQGYVNAQYRLGHFYYHGLGVSKDLQKAFEWFSKAAEQESAEAQLHLGDCYYYGEGTSKDISKAVFWYTKAANQGHPGAQFSLGCCYERGEGVIQDLEKATELYSKARKQGLLGRFRF